jgi:ribosomal protein S7
MATWSTEKRRADRASKVIERAIDHLESHIAFRAFSPDYTYAAEKSDAQACQVLRDAMKRIADELDARRDDLGVGAYQPYGRVSTVRRYS